MHYKKESKCDATTKFMNNHGNLLNVENEIVMCNIIYTF